MTHALAVEGANRAAAHADRTHGNWTDRAYNFLERWVGGRIGFEFMTEDVRVAAENSGSYVAPPDERAWGAVILRAKREGRLEHTGRYEPMKSSNCHGNPKSVWRWIK